MDKLYKIAYTYAISTFIVFGFDRIEAKHDPRKRTIPGYPENLKLMRIPASCFWWVDMYIPGGASSGVKKSTKCERVAAPIQIEQYKANPQ